MKLFCGLGNPGKQYEQTRHNAGFLFIDAFAKKHDFPVFTEKWKAQISEKNIAGEKVILLKPQTFMNLSGEALIRFVQFYKLNLNDLVLIYDDVDLPLGTLRYKESGSAGTHNGMKSVIHALGAESFPRLRLGVESRGVHMPEQMDLASFVLAPFSNLEKEDFDKMLSEGIELLEKKLA